MNSIIRIPFERTHWDLIEPHPVMAGLKAAMNVDAVLQFGRGVTWIDTDKGLVIGCAGYVQRREGVAWMWFLPSTQAPQFMVRVTRFFKHWVSTLEDGIRVEAHVLATFTAGNRWAEMLGMYRENAEPIEKWDGEDDYHLYARVTGDAETDQI
jgi:hypothetical protein